MGYHLLGVLSFTLENLRQLKRRGTHGNDNLSLLRLHRNTCFDPTPLSSLSSPPLTLPLPLSLSMPHQPSSSTPPRLHRRLHTAISHGVTKVAVAHPSSVFTIFLPYGKVQDVYLMRDEMKQSRGCGFVKYYQRDMAQAAINALNGIYTMRVQLNTSCLLGH
ncbi:hypothetical protein ACS0TY_035495 [Phlomoides rotata]